VGIVSKLSWVCTIIVFLRRGKSLENRAGQGLGRAEKTIGAPGFAGAPVGLVRTFVTPTGISRSGIRDWLRSRPRSSRHRRRALSLRRSAEIQPVRAVDHIHQREQDHCCLPAEDMADCAHHRCDSRAQHKIRE